MKVLVVGMGVSGEAAGRQLARRGYEVVAVDDRPAGEARRRAETLGLELTATPGGPALGALVA
ncbi:MAG: hypothetical protein ACRD0M_08050, partial [Acidimicrobiales bacterium]